MDDFLLRKKINGYCIHKYNELSRLESNIKIYLKNN